MEDITRIVILYEFFVKELLLASLMAYEMTLCVVFCLSYDPINLKWE